MSTRCTTPQASAAGSTRCATLWVPKVTVTVAATCGPSTWPVSTSTPGRDVHGDDRHAVERRAPRPPRRRAGRRGRRCRRSRRRPRRGARPRPTDSDDPAAGVAQRREARGVHLVGAEQQRLDLHAAPGEQHPGVQRVAAVVARPDEQQHPRAVRPAQQVEHGVGQPARRPAASARPRAAAPSGRPRPPGPARRCVRCASGQPTQPDASPRPPTARSSAPSRPAGCRARRGRTPARDRAGRAATPTPGLRLR